MFIEIIFLMGLLIPNCSSQTLTQAKSLRTLLFTTNAYDLNVRQKTDQSVATDVYVDFDMAGINGLDGVLQKFTVTGFLTVKWKDESLTWTPASYGGIQTLFVSQALVWKPSLALKNGFTKLSELGSTFLDVKVDYQGNVEWKPYEVFDSKCPVNTKYYPFDTQTCGLEFVIWETTNAEVKIQKGTTGLQLNDYDASPEWDILELTTETEQEGSITTLIFKTRIKRKPMFIIVNMILPVFLLGLLDVFTFVLPADCGEKMSYAVTVFLANAVFLTIVSGTLPANSTTTPLISEYLIFLICLGVVVLMLASIQIRMLKWDYVKRVPPFLKKITLLTRRLRCRNRTTAIKGTDASIEYENKNKSMTCDDITSKHSKDHADDDPDDDVTWSEVSSATDIHFFIFFLFTLLLATIVVVIVGTTN